MKYIKLTSLSLVVIGFAVSAAAVPANSSKASDNGLSSPQNELVVQDSSKKVVYVCPMHPEVAQLKEGKCPKCGMKLTAKLTALKSYTCPMHPEVVADKYGKCPKCGMNLVLKEPVKEKKNL
jgi:hypothetical protein